jgi:hypothetical protein
MVVSAFVGWAHFMPAVGSPSTINDEFVSSPIGLGTDPLRVGGFLMVVCGLVLFGRGYFLKRRREKSPLLWLVIIVVVTVTYIAISIATWFEIRPWTQTVLTQRFTSPSGRALFPLSNAPGFGAGLSVFAVAVSVLATVLFCTEAREVSGFKRRRQ